VCNFRIATSEKWKDRDGKAQEKTEWHRIVAWAKLGEVCNEYLSKGRQVYVEGQITTNEWEDKEGNKRYTTEIKATTVQFLGGGAQASDRQPEEPNSKGTSPADGWDPPPPITDDDVPF